MKGRSAAGSNRLLPKNGFTFLDVFPPLEKSARQGNLLYHSSSDAHLNARAIALWPMPFIKRCGTNYSLVLHTIIFASRF